MFWSVRCNDLANSVHLHNDVKVQALVMASQVQEYSLGSLPKQRDTPTFRDITRLPLTVQLAVEEGLLKPGSRTYISESSCQVMVGEGEPPLLLPGSSHPSFPGVRLVDVNTARSNPHTLPIFASGHFLQPQLGVHPINSIRRLPPQLPCLLLRQGVPRQLRPPPHHVRDGPLEQAQASRVPHHVKPAVDATPESGHLCELLAGGILFMSFHQVAEWHQTGLQVGGLQGE